MLEPSLRTKTLHCDSTDRDHHIHILVISEGEIATTQILEQIVKACGAFGLTYEKRLLKHLRPIDFSPDVMPLFLRCSGPYAQLWSRILTNAGIQYAYYIDDNFWELTGDSAVARYYRRSSIRRSLASIIAGAHTLVTNSPELASVVSKFNNRTIILPTFFDFSILEGRNPDNFGTATDEIRIGFAGSAGRIDDLDLISDLIPNILNSHSDVVFEFIGVMPRNIQTANRVRFFPPIDNYEKYIEFQLSRNWDIALAPLADHPANRCKSDVKYREYSAFQYPGIYSNIPPYKDVVLNSVTGLLVNNTEHEWLEAISDLIGHPDKRAAMAKQAFDHSRQRYDILRVADKWANAILKIADDQTRNLGSLEQTFLRREKLIADIELYMLRIRFALLGRSRKFAEKILSRFFR
jgi:glycosyltransferase involved in cell wall biosynthesis